MAKDPGGSIQNAFLHTHRLSGNVVLNVWLAVPIIAVLPVALQLHFDTVKRFMRREGVSKKANENRERSY